MQNESQRLKGHSGMTLVEILVALVILGMVLMAIFPLLTQSLQVTNLANTITSRLFGDQENIEIVAATNGGVYFADGTFLANKNFPVVFGGNVTPVPGMTVKKAKLIRFLGSIPHLSGSSVYEGYTEEEAVITIAGKNTNFIDTTSTVLKVTDKNGSDVTSHCSNYTVNSKSEAEITIPTDSNRFTNFDGPYFVYLTTGNEKISALLQVHMPRAVIVKENHDLLIASSPTPTNWEDGSGNSNWVNKITHAEIKHKLNKVISIRGSEQESCFVAVGDEGSIYRWDYGEKWRRLSLPLKAANQDANLNNILPISIGFLVVGDEGVILYSSEGINWKQMNSDTNANLRGITYFDDKNKYVCVGEGGIILTSPDTKKWTPLATYPRLAEDAINGKNAVEFSGFGDYLKTATAPVTGSNSRTVFMVVKPEPTAELKADTLLSWGSPLDTEIGGRFSFRINSEKLALEKETSSIFTSDINVPNDTASMLICRSDPDNPDDFNKYLLYKNGAVYAESDISGTINTKDTFPAQLGSDPLTRYTGPLPYRGLIYEVLVFASGDPDEPDINVMRTERDPDLGEYDASEMDLIRKYLSDKYDLGIVELDNTTLDKLYYPGTARPLTEPITGIPEDFLSAESFNNQVLWLDASTFYLKDEQQVLFWNDRSGTGNHASGAALNAVACNDEGQLIAGGTHRNLILYEDDIIQDKFLNGDTDPVVQYSLDDLLFANDRFVALLNSNLGSTDSYIATFNRKGVSCNDREDSTESLNDIFYHTDGQTLIVVGNKSTILYSTNYGATWSSSKSNTTSNLLAGCLR